MELDLGLDSMQRVELLTALEQQMGGEVPEAQLAEIYTVRDLVDAVLESERRGEGGTRKSMAPTKPCLTPRAVAIPIPARMPNKGPGSRVWTRAAIMETAITAKLIATVAGRALAACPNTTAV